MLKRLKIIAKDLLVYLLMPVSIGYAVFRVVPYFFRSLMRFYTKGGLDYFFDVEYMRGVFTQHARFTLGVVFLYVMAVIVWRGVRDRLKYGLINYAVVALVLTIRVIEVRMQVVNRTSPEHSVPWDYDNIHNLIWQVMLVLFVINMALMLRKSSILKSH